MNVIRGQPPLTYSFGKVRASNNILVTEKSCGTKPIYLGLRLDNVMVSDDGINYTNVPETEYSGTTMGGPSAK